MGKWATYQKRGSNRGFGTMVAPVAADWTLTSPVAANYSVNRISAIPAPAARWGARVRVGTTAAWTNTVVQAATPITNGATSGVTLYAQIAWFDAANVQLSPWSEDVKSVVIT